MIGWIFEAIFSYLFYKYKCTDQNWYFRGLFYFILVSFSAIIPKNIMNSISKISKIKISKTFKWRWYSFFLSKNIIHSIGSSLFSRLFCFSGDPPFHKSIKSAHDFDFKLSFLYFLFCTITGNRVDDFLMCIARALSTFFLIQVDERCQIGKFNEFSLLLPGRGLRDYL